MNRVLVPGRTYSILQPERNVHTVPTPFITSPFRTVGLEPCGSHRPPSPVRRPRRPGGLVWSPNQTPNPPPSCRSQALVPSSQPISSATRLATDLAFSQSSNACQNLLIVESTKLLKTFVESSWDARTGLQVGFQHSGLQGFDVDRGFGCSGPSHLSGDSGCPCTAATRRG